MVDKRSIKASDEMDRASSGEEDANFLGRQRRRRPLFYFIFTFFITYTSIFCIVFFLFSINRAP